MARKEKPMQPVVAPPTHKSKSTFLPSLIGFLSLILGAYLLLEYFNIFKINFKIPLLTAPILLVLCGIFLLKETSNRSLLSRFKSHYDKYI